MSINSGSKEHSNEVTYTLLPEYPIWDNILKNHGIISFSLEITARCNNNCRHCYINLPANDRDTIKCEMSIGEIERIADEAVSLGAMWCLISGGEPLLRNDFKEIYLMLKKKGLLITVFTNGTLITEDIVQFFKKYPPRDIEISVYGVTKETYERITRKKGSFDAFIRGLNLLRANGVPANLKSMILRSNVHESEKIAQFCRERSKAKYRYDPMLHLRYDRNQAKNRDIISERLMPDEIVALEINDTDRFGALKKKCADLNDASLGNGNNDYTFRCNLGRSEFTVSYDGKIKLCSSLCTPGFTYDLRSEKGTIEDAFKMLSSRAHNLRSNSIEFQERCGNCAINNLCICCPAHAWLETYQMDKPVEYFCEVAKARASALSKFTRS